MAAGEVTLLPVSGRRTIDQFIRTPWHIYRDDPAWSPPLYLERRLHLSRLNPFCRHGTWQGWVAVRGGLPVGRISAQTDTLYQQRYGADGGHFGMLEAIDDAQVFALLFETAEQWLRERGVRQITGPFNFSVNQECGLLVDGFESPPVVMMPHGRPWYARRVEALGYAPAQDLLAYWIHSDFEHPRAVQALVRRFSGRVRIRPLQRGRLAAELETLRAIFNDAWSDNWGFVPFTREEFQQLGMLLRWLVDDDFVQIAEVDGQAAAFVVVLPDINAASRDLNGSLFPFGWARLLWRLKRNQVQSGRIPLMGVSKQYQNTLLGSMLAFMVVTGVQTPARERGIRGVELSWILEDNTGMRGILELFGSRLYKRYRLYHKELDANS